MALPLINPFRAGTVFRRRISSKDGLSTEKIKIILMAVNQQHDFKLKKPFGLHGLYTNISALYGLGAELFFYTSKPWGSTLDFTRRLHTSDSDV